MRIDGKKEGIRQSMSWLHTWISLLLGWLLFAIFLTGTLSFFQNEITVWMKPELHQSLTNQSQQQQLTTALNMLQQRAPDAASWNINLPTERQTTTGINIQQEGGQGGGGRRGGLTFDTATGEEIKARETRGGGFLYRFHFELYGMERNTARWIVGIATMFMFIAIISGIITHKKIFKDFFTFRPGKGQRSWLDAHNATAVFALPFHLMITFSGLLLLMYTIMPWGINQVYEGGRREFLSAQNGGSQQQQGQGQRGERGGENGIQARGEGQGQRGERGGNPEFQRGERGGENGIQARGEGQGQRGERGGNPEFQRGERGGENGMQARGEGQGQRGERGGNPEFQRGEHGGENGMQARGEGQGQHGERGGNPEFQRGERGDENGMQARGEGQGQRGERGGNPEFQRGERGGENGMQARGEGQGQRGERGDNSEFQRGERGGEGHGEEQPVERAVPATMTDLTKLLTYVQQQWAGKNRVASVIVTAPNTVDAQIEMRAVASESLIHRNQTPSFKFNAITGELIAKENQEITTTIPSAIYNLTTWLHQGRGIGLGLRWLLFLSGVLGTLMVATGLVLWVVKRQPDVQKLGYKPWSHRIVEILNVPAVAGLTIACGTYFWANRLIPAQLEERSNLEIKTFFIVWLITLIHSAIRPYRKAWLEQLALGGILFLLIPVLNPLTGGRGLWSSIYYGQWVVATFDLACLIIAAISLYAFYRLKRYPQTPIRVKKVPIVKAPKTENLAEGEA